MLEILRDGSIESGEQIMELAERYGRALIPNENDDLDLTHWSVIRDDGAETLYAGSQGQG